MEVEQGWVVDWRCVHVGEYCARVVYSGMA